MSDDKPRPNLAQIAKDCVDCKLFGTWQIPKRDDNMVGSIFMPVLFGGDDAFKGVAHLFEYYDKAGKMSINGYPIFFSCYYIKADEWPTFVDHLMKAEYRLAKAELWAKLEGGDRPLYAVWYGKLLWYFHAAMDKARAVLSYRKPRKAQPSTEDHNP